MAYKKIDVEKLPMLPFKELGKDWVLISAKKDDIVNTMTASWGGLGVLWKRNVATVYIRPQRYTKEFVDASEYFTITFFEGYKKELGVLGTKSGRDGDKIKEVEFTTEMIEDQPTFKEGKMVWICKKLYQDNFKAENFIDPSINDDIYPNKDHHEIYIGEIIAAYQNQE